MYKSMEFVCGGNNGRSPVCLAVARKFVDLKKIEGIELLSSGLYVSEMGRLSDNQLKGLLLPRLGEALKNNLISATEYVDFQEGERVREICEKLVNHETERRTAVLKEKGLFKYLQDHFPQQIAYRQDAENGLILGMTWADVQHISAIYATPPYPKIDSLCSFAGISGDIPDAFFKSDSEYERIVNRIEEATDKAMEKAIA